MYVRPPRSNRRATLFPSCTLSRVGRAGRFSGLAAPNRTRRASGKRRAAVAMAAFETTRSRPARASSSGVRIRSSVPGADSVAIDRNAARSEEHTSELQSLMRISYAVFCLKKKKKEPQNNKYEHV